VNDNTLPPSAQEPPIQQSVADAATASAIDSIVTNKPPEQIERAFSRATVENRRNNPEGSGSPDQAWRNGNAAEPLSPMPAPPTIERSEVDNAIAKLNNLGGDHAALVQKWGSDMADNLAYGREAYSEIVAKHPDIIAKVDASPGLGNHPAVLELLSQFGRQKAGMMGTLRNNNSSTPAPFMPTFIPSPARTSAGPSGNARGSEETSAEMNRLMSENPPGSDRYKDPAVQARIGALSRILAGSGSPIGRGGRTS
jgi:hypothetical protein